MASTKARQGPGVKDRGGNGLLYSRPRLFSTKYAYGPSLHDPPTELGSSRHEVTYELAFPAINT